MQPGYLVVKKHFLDYLNLIKEALELVVPGRGSEAEELIEPPQWVVYDGRLGGIPCT